MYTVRKVKMMRIGFVLPRFSLTPIGGFKVVYEYAVHLAENGHQVYLFHPRRLSSARSFEDRIKEPLWIQRCQRQLRQSFWFPSVLTTPGVQMQFVPVPSPFYLPDLDAIIATGWRTAPWIAQFPPSKGRKYYLIQHYEVWDGPKEEVDATWQLPLHKIVIARWLYDLGEKNFDQGKRMTYIPNGIDFTHLRMTVPPSERSVRHIGMLYHTNYWKGTEIGLKALDLVKEHYPDLQSTVFGAPPRGQDIPSWIKYLRLPSPLELEAYYNSCTIFVHPSLSEGWPLPPAEAMACGAALTACSNEGVRDYAQHNKNALLSPPGDAESLAENIMELIRKPDLRIQLAEEGHRHIRQFTWELATTSLEQVLTQKP